MISSLSDRQRSVERRPQTRFRREMTIIFIRRQVNFSIVDEEERAGTFNPQEHSKDSLLSSLDYARSFQEIQDLRIYLISRKPTEPVASERDNIVGFGCRAKNGVPAV
ncbi:unnamed protein product [Arctogadus glacialis]